MCKISVIVPVYNLKDYLERCINSLTEQRYKELDIILVDDGSTDGSSALCDSFAEKDPRIRVVHKANGGLSSARNAGLKMAVGDYVSFIDGDDYVDANLYSDAVSIVAANEPDLLRFGYCKLNHGRILRRCVMDYPEGLYSADSLHKLKLDAISYPDVLDHRRQRILSACTNLYRRAFLQEHGLRFVSEREVLNEDYLFVLQAMCLSQRVYIWPQAYYYYDTRSNSLTTSYRPQMLQRKQALYEAYCACLPLDNPEAAERLDNFYIDCVYACVLNECISGKPSRCAIREIRVLLQDERLALVLKRSWGRIKSLQARFICFLMQQKAAALCYFGYNLMKHLKG